MPDFPTLKELEENFSLFGNKDECSEYLIDLGKRLKPMDDSLKTEETLVKGCTSKVWLIVETHNQRFHFTADSDGKITRGLVYLLMAAYQDKTAEEIRAVDIHGSFDRMGLHQHLSPNRRNGFYAMLQRIRTLAAAS